MKNLRSLLVLSLTTVSLLLAATAAKADSFAFVLNPAFQSGAQSMFAFDATVTNNSTSTVYLNSDNISTDSPLTVGDVDDGPYNSNSNWFVLAPGASYSGLLFNVNVPAGMVGDFTGSFQILGGYDDPSEQTPLGTADFEVVVTPEPSSFLLLGTGLAGAFTAIRKRRFSNV